MSSKYIDNATYATSGYTLSGVFQSITIGPKGVIGGNGLIGGSTEAYTIDNSGTLSGGYGIRLKDGGTITNSGQIGIAGNYSIGVYISGGAGIVHNTGTILGQGAGGDLPVPDGMVLDAGGTVINSGAVAIISSIYIAGGTGAVINSNGANTGDIVIKGGTGIIDNTGSIEGRADSSGVTLDAGGKIINSGATALIIGAFVRGGRRHRRQ